MYNMAPPIPPPKPVRSSQIHRTVPPRIPSFDGGLEKRESMGLYGHIYASLENDTASTSQETNNDGVYDVPNVPKHNDLIKWWSNATQIIDQMPDKKGTRPLISPYGITPIIYPNTNSREQPMSTESSTKLRRQRLQKCVRQDVLQDNGNGSDICDSIEFHETGTNTKFHETQKIDELRAREDKRLKSSSEESVQQEHSQAKIRLKRTKLVRRQTEQQEKFASDFERKNVAQLFEMTALIQLKERTVDERTGPAQGTVVAI